MKATEGPYETSSICKQTPSVKAGGFNVDVVKVNMKYTRIFLVFLITSQNKLRENTIPVNAQTPNKFSKRSAHYAQIMACTCTTGYILILCQLWYTCKTNKKAFQSSAKFEHGQQGPCIVRSKFNNFEPVGGPCMARVGMPGGGGLAGSSPQVTCA